MPHTAVAAGASSSAGDAGAPDCPIRPGGEPRSEAAWADAVVDGALGSDEAPRAEGGPVANGALEPAPSPSSGGARRPFRWLGDAAEALALARQQRRPLLVDFYAEWCPPCQLLESTSLRDPLVWTEIELGYVPLRIDVTEETARSRALLELFAVDALPTLLVVDGSGREVDRLLHYLPAEPLAEWLALARAGSAASGPAGRRRFE